MTNSNRFAPYDADALPAAIVRYLAAKDDIRGRESIIDVFAADASVTDERIRYDGRDAILAWLGTVATEFTYTTTLIGQRREGDSGWVVLARLEGDFPGGIAELGFRFTVQADHIAELVIAPA